MTDATLTMLEATGFSSHQAQRYERCKREGRTDECVRMLRRRRCELVDALHEAQRPIDVIDWAIADLEHRVR